MSNKRDKVLTTKANGRNTPKDNNQIQKLDFESSLEIFEFSKALPEKNPKVIRLFYNNCNGISINNTIHTYLYQKRQKQKQRYLKDIDIPTKLDRLIQLTQGWETDIVCLAETNTAWEEKTPRRVIQKISKKYDDTCCWTVSSSSINMGNFLKPGGTGILATNGFPGKTIERGTDPWRLGRWSYIVLHGKYRKLLIVTGYRVGKRTSKAGPSTAWSQQKTLLLKAKRTEEPQTAFITDLRHWMEEYKQKGYCIVLFLDANEQWTKKSEIKELAENLQLNNINHQYNLGFTHPNLAYPRKSTTIDYCLCCENVTGEIKYASLAPYELDTLGDHRGIVVDIDINKLLGHKQVEQRVSYRKLTTSNPSSIKKYLDIVEENFEQQKIFHRAKKLLQRINTGHTDLKNIKKKYKQIDSDVHGICKNAEKLCRRTISGPYKWSPILITGIKTVTYWRHRLKTDKENPLLRKLGEELKIQYQKLKKAEIKTKIKESREALENLRKNAVKHRCDHLQNLAKNYATQNNVSMNTAINELIAHEGIRHTFATLKDRLKKHNTGQLSSLWVSKDENGNYDKNNSTKEIFTDEESIHSKILERNYDHLQQASETPFANGNLKKGLKWDGTGHLSDKILSGDILNEQRFSASMQLYLESIRVRDLTKLNVVNPTLTLEEYYNFWKKKRENTVTSPFGLHIGHYKAALMNQKILEVHRVLLLIPFLTGIVPRRWRRTVQTMLEKETGAPWIHRLRIIELFDAQANAGFQIFVGRKMIQNAVSKDLLQPESFGSTPGKMAGSAILQKLLSIDQLRVERRAGAIFDCDASGCYDRILPPLAAVHLRSLGLNKSISTFLARLMYFTKRHVSTKHGVSENNIRTSKDTVLHGIGQGNGGGPAIWISHLTVMFKAISSICSGFTASNITQKENLSTVGTGYVDDVTLVSSTQRDQAQTYSMVKNQIKQMGQVWENLLYISGGRLELTKCFWVPIVWNWKGGKPYISTRNKNRQRDLTLTESETTYKITIPKKGTKDFEKRLGVWTNCEATWSKEFKSWIEYSRQFGKKIKWAGLDRVSGYHAYHSLWIAKFRYSAPVVGFTTSQIKQIYTMVVGPCLSAGGYCSKMPRAVVFGPTELGGMD